MLYVHRSERADHLVAILAGIMGDPLPDPMTSEVVAVPTRGVERWLAQRLSHRLGAQTGSADGVCANVRFPFPGRLVTVATEAATGRSADRGDDPWSPERAVWTLLDVVDAHIDDDLLGPLAAHLRDASPGAGRPRRFATVRHLADLFHEYGVQRPQLIQAWASGEDGGIGPADRWQPGLWRLLRARIGQPSPAERLAETAKRLIADGDCLDLPERISVFGLTRLPPAHLAVFEAIGHHRDVHLLLLHPSGALWEAVAGQADVARAGSGSGLRRADDPTVRLAAHPLLRSWGRDAREMELVLLARGGRTGTYRPVEAGATTLLGRLQSDVRADRPPPPPLPPGRSDDRPILSPEDDSLRIHSCHGDYRQVEVARDAVLHLLTAHPHLEPRDVIIMCPDIEVFAPLVQAVFGGTGTDAAEVDGSAGSPGSDGSSGSTGPAGLAGAAGSTGTGSGRYRPGVSVGHRDLRVRIADRSLPQTNPVLAVAAHLLELAGGRLGAPEVLDLVSREPVRRRFRFDDDDLAQIERWVLDMGVRWGLDAAHRSRWKLGPLEANTWSAGLDRLLLGVAMADEDQRVFAGAVPLDDVTGSTADLAGRFAELVARLSDAVDALTGEQPVTAWRDAILGCAQSLAMAALGDEWQQDELRRVLDDVVRASGGLVEPGAPGGPMPSLDLTEVRSLVEEHLRARPTRANFRTGDLTVCTLVPMRSVPHRVVCLLGLDDGVFPRHPEADGDDLLLRDAHVGDRDPRSEDRQLLLDALLAATEHLIITYSGRDERTNHQRPPSVPVAELIDTIDRTVRVADPARRPGDVVVVEHPLHPFDPRNFTEAALGVAGPWSFDGAAAAGARALRGPRRDPMPFLDHPLDPLPGAAVSLESVVRFVEHPTRAFLRERLGLYVGGDPDEVSDRLPLELDALQRWEVGDRLLAAVLGGSTLDDAVTAERRRGTLPPGGLADGILADVLPAVESLFAAAAGLPGAAEPALSVEVNVPLPGGRFLIGTVPSVRGSTIVRCLYSSLGPKHRLAAWVRLLALTAARPDRAVTAATLGRGARLKAHSLIRVSILPPLGAEADSRRAVATQRLAEVVDLYDRGMREPLPVFCSTSAAWAEASRAGEDRIGAARAAWDDRGEIPGERADPAHRLVLRGDRSLDDVLAVGPAEDETGAGWATSESTRLGRLARRLWDPLASHETKAEL